MLIFCISVAATLRASITVWMPDPVTPVTPVTPEIPLLPVMPDLILVASSLWIEIRDQ